MKTCALCEQKAGVFPHRIYEGYICKECFRRVPSCISLRDTDEHYLRRMKAQSEEREKTFEATSYYGKMYLDAVHGMVCYSDKGKEGSPLFFGDIYKITELKELGLNICNIRDISKKCFDVRCDVKLCISTADTHAEYIIARNKECVVHHKGEGKYDCNEPIELTMIRSMLKQMIDDVLNGLNQKVKKIQLLQEMAKKEPPKPKRQQDVEWAKGILFLENTNCSVDTIKKRYRELCHMYHPDIHPDVSDEYIKKLNKAYEILTN